MNKNEIVYVNIHGNPVPTVLHNGKPYVGMKALCEQMGLDWKAQYDRIKRDNNLGATMVMMTIVATDDKSREMVCLPLEMINGWLFGIDAGRGRRRRRSGGSPRRQAARILTAADSAAYTESLSKTKSGSPHPSDSAVFLCLFGTHALWRDDSGGIRHLREIPCGGCF